MHSGRHWARCCLELEYTVYQVLLKSVYHVGRIAKGIKAKGLIRLERRPMYPPDWSGKLESEQGQEVIFHVTTNPGLSLSSCKMSLHREANQSGFSLTFSKNWHQWLGQKTENGIEEEVFHILWPDCRTSLSLLISMEGLSVSFQSLVKNSTKVLINAGD